MCNSPRCTLLFVGQTAHEYLENPRKNEAGKIKKCRWVFKIMSQSRILYTKYYCCLKKNLNVVFAHLYKVGGTLYSYKTLVCFVGNSESQEST